MGVAAVAVLALAACGDDDDGGGGAAPGSVAESATTTASSGGADTTTAATTGGSGGGGGGEGRELIIARDMDLTTLDPSRAYCDTCQIYLSAVYQTLIGVDPTDLKKLLPRLATEVGGERRQHRLHVHPRSEGDVRRRLAGDGR